MFKVWHYWRYSKILKNDLLQSPPKCSILIQINTVFYSDVSFHYLHSYTNLCFCALEDYESHMKTTEEITQSSLLLTDVPLSTGACQRILSVDNKEAVWLV